MAVIGTLLAALLAAAAAWSVGVPSGLVRSRVAVGRGDSPDAGGQRRAALLAVGAGLGVLVLVHGVTGWVLAGSAAYGVHRWLSASTSRGAELDRTRRALALPVALDLLSACLAIGASQRESLGAVAEGLHGSLGDDLMTVARALELGADSAEAWSLVEASDLHPLRSVLTRVEVTGAPVTPLLTLLAEQQRQRARVVALDAARALGVRLAGPLGLCFLPAFVLVAVVPLVVSLLPFDV